MMKDFLCVNYTAQNNTDISESPANPLLSGSNEEMQVDNKREHNASNDPGVFSGVYKTFDFYLITV